MEDSRSRIGSWQIYLMEDRIGCVPLMEDRSGSDLTSGS